MRTGKGKVLLLVLLALGIWGSAGAADDAATNPADAVYSVPASQDGVEQNVAGNLVTNTTPAPRETADDHGGLLRESAEAKAHEGGSIKLDAVFGVLGSTAALIALVSMMM